MSVVGAPSHHRGHSWLDAFKNQFTAVADYRMRVRCCAQAMYPELLLIQDAVLDPTSSGAEIKYLPGDDGALDWGALGWLCVRLVLALYLLASGLARFDRSQLMVWEWIGRLVLAALIMASSSIVYGPAMAAALVLIVVHFVRSFSSASRAAAA